MDSLAGTWVCYPDRVTDEEVRRHPKLAVSLIALAKWKGVFTLELDFYVSAKEFRMKQPVPAREASQRSTTKPFVNPSVPQPKPDPLHEVRDVVRAIRNESALAPGEYLNEIRSVFGAE